MGYPRTSEKATQQKYGLRTLKMHEQNISHPQLTLTLSWRRDHRPNSRHALIDRMTFRYFNELWRMTFLRKPRGTPASHFMHVLTLRFWQWKSLQKRAKGEWETKTWEKNPQRWSQNFLGKQKSVTHVILKHNISSLGAFFKFNKA